MPNALAVCAATAASARAGRRRAERPGHARRVEADVSRTNASSPSPMRNITSMPATIAVIRSRPLAPHRLRHREGGQRHGRAGMHAHAGLAQAVELEGVREGAERKRRLRHVQALAGDARQPARPACPARERFGEHHRRPRKPLAEDRAADRVDQAMLGALDRRTPAGPRSAARTRKSQAAARRFRLGGRHSPVSRAMQCRTCHVRSSIRARTIRTDDARVPDCSTARIADACCRTPRHRGALRSGLPEIVRSIAGPCCSAPLACRFVTFGRLRAGRTDTSLQRSSRQHRLRTVLREFRGAPSGEPAEGRARHQAGAAA